MKRFGGIFLCLLISSAAVAQEPVGGQKALTADNVMRPLPNPRRGSETVQDWRPLTFRNVGKGHYAIEKSETLLHGILKDGTSGNRFVLAQDYLKEIPTTDPVIAFNFIESEDPVTNEILKRLASKYDMGLVDGEEGYRHLVNMAKNKSKDKVGFEVSSENFDFVAEPEAEIAYIEPAPVMSLMENPQAEMDPVASIINSISREQIAVMRPDQLGAIVAAVKGGQVPTQIPPIASVQPAVLNGVPSLDFKGEISDLEMPQAQVISTNDVPNGANPFSQEQVPQQTVTPQPAYNPMPTPAQVAQMAPARVGDGKSMILKGWKLGMTSDGGIGMYLEGDPGSIIEISEGMVVGPLGPVERIMMENGSIMARFASGDVITSPATLVNMTSS